jgi:hypothetical protein
MTPTWFTNKRKLHNYNHREKNKQTKTSNYNHNFKSVAPNLEEVYHGWQHKEIMKDDCRRHNLGGILKCTCHHKQKD